MRLFYAVDRAPHGAGWTPRAFATRADMLAWIAADRAGRFAVFASDLTRDERETARGELLDRIDAQ